MSLSVLIVDDSPVMRGFIRRVINLSGLEISGCLEAANGVEALSQLHQGKVDVVLTDINMPVMNGEELVRNMKSEGLLADIATVVVSTDATEQRIRKLIELGAHGYVTKPFTPEVLRETLEKVLEGMGAAAQGCQSEGQP
jgi:two-component system chemotaxis response regulator CheY